MIANNNKTASKEEKLVKDRITAYQTQAQAIQEYQTLLSKVKMMNNNMELLQNANEHHTLREQATQKLKDTAFTLHCLPELKQETEI